MLMTNIFLPSCAEITQGHKLGAYHNKLLEVVIIVKDKHYKATCKITSEAGSLIKGVVRIDFPIGNLDENTEITNAIYTDLAMRFMDTSLPGKYGLGVTAYSATAQRYAVSHEFIGNVLDLS